MGERVPARVRRQAGAAGRGASGAGASRLARGPPGARARRVGELVQVRFARRRVARRGGSGDRAGRRRRAGDRCADGGPAPTSTTRPTCAAPACTWCCAPTRSRRPARRRGGPARARSTRYAAARRRGSRRGCRRGSAALARGMVLGEDERDRRRVREDFKRSGLAHLLAVSGQNVTLLAILAWPLLAAAGPRAAQAAGGDAGADRALRAAHGRRARRSCGPARWARRERWRRWPDARRRAGTRCCWPPPSRSCIDPRAWLDAGWQLSFAAVVGIFGLARPLTRASRRCLPRPLADGAGGHGRRDARDGAADGAPLRARVAA